MRRLRKSLRLAQEESEALEESAEAGLFNWCLLVAASLVRTSRAHYRFWMRQFGLTPPTPSVGSWPPPPKTKGLVGSAWALLSDPEVVLGTI